MQRLAALVPRPRLHLIRFHGVLAPNAKIRGKIIRSPSLALRSARSRGASLRTTGDSIRSEFFLYCLAHNIEG